MGGNVFKHDYTVRRLQKEEYFQYSEKVLLLILKCTGPILLHITTAIRSKEDFGDMDIIVCGRDKRQLIEDMLIKEGYPMQRNGDVTSFLYIDFQIDLIFTDKDHYMYSCNYFDWNDLGNLIGRMSKQLGFKHGHDGLYYVLRNDDRIIKEFRLSTEYLDIIHILGLDKYKFRSGFEKYEDLFKFVCSSPYFNPETFKLENLNHINKVRDRKRKTYNMFLQYISENYSDHVSTIRKLSYEEKESFVVKKFPWLKHELDELKAEVELNNKIKERINGRIIMQLVPSAKGEKVGEYIQAIKERRPDLYSAKILEYTEEEIHLGILVAIDEHNKVVRPYVHN